MYTKAKRKFKQEKVYVNARNANSKVLKGNKQDGKRVVRVDPRMKKEKRASKRIEKKGSSKKGGGAGPKGKRAQKSNRKMGKRK